MHVSNIYDDDRFFDRYARMLRSRQGLSGAGEWHQLRKLFPNLNGKSMLDLGCGYGWHCRYAAENGAARVLGIDLSEKMIRVANEKNTDPKITYRLCDLDSYDYPAAAYDCVVSNLVLHYVEDIEAIFRKVYATLKPDGVFILNMEHPVFTAGMGQDWVYDSDGKALHWPLDNYFYPGERTTYFLEQPVIKQHHTLTQILMGLTRSGFLLEVVEEAMPSAETMHNPAMENEMRRPMMLLVKALKQEAR